MRNFFILYASQHYFPACVLFEYSIKDNCHEIDTPRSHHEFSSKNQALMYASVLGYPVFLFEEVVNYIEHKDPRQKYLLLSDIKNLRNILDN